MKIGASYRRVSTRQQQETGYSLPTQLLEISAYAASHDIKIVADYTDDETGYDNLRRQGLSEIRRLVQEKAIDALVVHDSDRLIRKSSDYVLLREELSRAGVELHYVTRGHVPLDDFGQQIVEDIYGRFAELERQKILERMNRGKRGKVLDGKVVTTRPPYGYRVEDSQFVIEPETAQVIEGIYELYLEGQSVPQITKRLTAQRIPTYADLRPEITNKKGGYGEWSESSVLGILKSETYKGVWYWSKNKTLTVKGNIITRPRDKAEWMPVEVPAIISEEIWDRVQMKIKSKGGGPRNIKNQYLLARRLTCQCGQPMYSRKQRIGKNHTARYYLCKSTQEKAELATCTMPYFRSEELDTEVWAWIVKLVTDPDFLRELLTSSTTRLEAIRRKEITELETVRERLVSESERLEKLVRTYIGGAIGDSVFNKLKAEIDQVIVDLKVEEAELLRIVQTGVNRAAHAGNAERIVQKFQDARAAVLLQDAPPKLKRAWIDALDLRAQLEVKEDMSRFAHITCVIGEDTIPVDGSLSRQPELIWYIGYTLELPPLYYSRRMAEV